MGGGGATYDYGFRIYNPGIAKFLSVDPLSGRYPWYTPYQFAGNSPIYNIDMDGLEPAGNPSSWKIDNLHTLPGNVLIYQANGWWVVQQEQSGMRGHKYSFSKER